MRDWELSGEECHVIIWCGDGLCRHLPRLETASTIININIIVIILIIIITIIT